MRQNVDDLIDARVDVWKERTVDAVDYTCGR